MIALWLRASARRPRRAVTTVLVLAVLTVATAAALVGGDALARLFRDDALAEWGAVDVEARSARGPFLPDGAARLLTVKAGDAAISGAPRLVLRAVADAGGRREAQAVVLGVGAEEADFAPLVARAGVASTSGLATDAALVNARLARRLHLSVGGTVDLIVAVPEWLERIAGRDAPLRHDAMALPLRLRVAGVVADSAVADLHRAPNVLVRREVLQQAAGLSPAQSSALHLDVRTDTRDAAEDVIDALAPDAQRLGVVLAPVKADALDTADEEGGLFRSILMSLAALVLLASTAATVELLTALGLERSLELALLRTAGLRRNVAVRLLVGEGLLYAVVGVGLGLLLAVPAGHALAAVLADHFAGLEDTRGREQVALSTAVGLSPFLVGAGVVLLTAALAARSAARRVLAGDLDTPLRGVPVGPAPPPTGFGRPVAVLATGMFLLGAGASGSGPLLYLGLTLVLCAGWLRARRRTRNRERTDQRAACVALVWSLGGAAALGDFGSGVQAGFGVLTVAGVVAVASTSFLLAGRLTRVGRISRRCLPAGRAQVMLLVAAGWAQQSRDRSALRMCSVGGALFTAAALTVLGSAQSLPVDRQAGGFDAIGTSVVGVEARAASAVLDSVGVAVPHVIVPETAYATQRDDGPKRAVVYPVKLAAVTTEFIEAERFRVADALPEYRTAADALSAVLRDDDKAVVDRYALPEGAKVGDDVVLELRGVVRRLTLVAVLDTYLLDAVLVGGAPFDALAARSGGTFVFVRGDRPPERLASDWNAHQRAAGLDLRPVQELREEVVRVNRTFTDVFALMLLLGLVVVVVSIAASTSRSAHQRRAETAVLRALGCRRRTVVSALVAEPLLAGVLGALLGLGAGLAVLRALFALGYSSFAFVLDVPRLAVAVLGTLGLVLGTAIVAASASARRSAGEDLQALG
jgi:ABC-type lipoprotein release transport system permease subunit